MSDLAFREGTWDKGIWDAVATHNEYQIKARFLPEDAVLDIGAHIGAFAYVALDHGAGRVVCVEPDPDNFLYLRHNILFACGATDRAVLVSGAAFQAEEPFDARPLFLGNVGANTGGNSVLGLEGIPVACIPFDNLRRLATGWNHRRLRLLKLDCEGSEWGIVRWGDLSSVDAIVGEYHQITDPKAYRAMGHRTECDRGYLRGLLQGYGFTVATRATSQDLGLFWAWRHGKEFASVMPD